MANIDEFVLDWRVKLQWIAFFTLWVLWGLVSSLRYVLADDNKTAAAQPADAEGGGGEKKAWAAQGGFAGRLANAHRVLFENTVLLLSVLVLNTIATGSTRAVLILTWIFFGFTVIAAFTEIGVNHRFVRLIFSLVFYGVTLAIGGLAFSQGFYA
ncbi:hypothetical protein BC940DRAFT_314308 [Gongronella butleri]|nr:hypothetical protein BC940DRAFT_314308 [Gongronella butleri]